MNKKDSFLISFLGDISLNNRYESIKISPFKRINKVLSKSAFVVGNLEAFLEGSEGFNLEKMPFLYCSKNAYKWLSDLNLCLVSTAHNHVYDNFDSGYKNTEDYLEKINVEKVGSSLFEELEGFAVIQKWQNQSIAFLNYCHSNTNFKKPNNTNIHLSIYQKDKIIRNIIEYKKKVDLIILLLHWGGDSDYGYFPTQNQMTDAHKFIDVGADAIIGHHAHCIQPVERYKGKPIYYCLGNFCFDDIICNQKTIKIRNSGKKGLIGQLQVLKNGNINACWMGIRNKNLQIERSYWVSFCIYVLNLFFFFYKRSQLLQKAHLYYLKKIEPVFYYLSTTNQNLVAFIFKRIYVKRIRK